MKNARNSRIDKQKIFSLVISFGIIVTLAFGIYSVVNNVKQKNNDNVLDLNETQEDVAINVKDSDKEDYETEAEAEANASASMETKSEPETEVKTEPTVPATLSAEEAAAEVLSRYSFDKGDTLAWPVEGEITLTYSMENTIFFKSLGMYKCSPGIIIAQEKGTNVGASASGVVKLVEDSEETNKTITVSIGNGYEVTYGLLDDVVVKKGDIITAGQLIGTVGEPSAYYKEEGPGVYFEVDKDGVPVNPFEYLPE